MSISVADTKLGRARLCQHDPRQCSRQRGPSTHGWPTLGNTMAESEPIVRSSKAATPWACRKLVAHARAAALPAEVFP